MQKNRARKLVGVVAIVITSLLGYGFLSDKKQAPTYSDSERVEVQNQDLTTAPVDFSASFAIFTNGTFRIFTAPMYHNLSPDVFIESSTPNTVRVKKSGTTWSNFFATLPFSLNSQCLVTGTKQTFCTNESGSLKFYINGIRDDSALTKEIGDGDKLLVTYGSESDEMIQLQRDRVPEIPSRE